MKVEVDILSSPSLSCPHGLCGRKATATEEDEEEVEAGCQVLPASLPEVDGGQLSWFDPDV